MIVHRIVTIFLLFFVLGHSDAWAHGGVVEEDDLCVIKVNYLRAHFKVYQPAVRGLEQFCEDLPAATQSIFVMEYQHDSLSEMEIDFRIIRDITGKGRFARLEDVEQIANIEGVLPGPSRRARCLSRQSRVRRRGRFRWHCVGAAIANRQAVYSSLSV